MKGFGVDRMAQRSEAMRLNVCRWTPSWLGCDRPGVAGMGDWFNNVA